MRKAEMTKPQLRDLNVFNLILESHGWVDQDDIEKRLDNGETLCVSVGYIDIVRTSP